MNLDGRAPAELEQGPLRRANEDAGARGMAPWHAPHPAYAGHVDRVRLHMPRWQGEPATPPVGSPYPAPEPRPAMLELAYTVRPFGQWCFDSFTGAHGVVARPGMAPAQLAGGQQFWEIQRRSFRAAPTVPWDVGTAVG